jgi:GH24 family phage-related lysozyme (muramidase)
MADKLDREQIDERVLRLLGLEDVFDLDPDEYLQLIREKIEAEKNRLSQEDLARLANERKRVRAEQRSSKKPNLSKAQSAIKFLKPSKVTGSQQVEFLKTEDLDKSENIIGIVTTIKKTVDSIYKTLVIQSKLFENINEQSRREREYNRRRKREEDLEKKDTGLIAVAKKILEPFQSIFDRIFKFLFFTLLGRAFVKFTEWASDPENKKKLEVLGRFLKDFFPALVGTYFLFGTSLGRFVRSIVGTVAKLSFHLARFAIPKLLSFVRAHPLLAIGATAGLATLGASMWGGKEKENLMQQESEKTGKPKEQIKTEVESAKRSPFAMFGEGLSNITGYKRGGEIFSGLVGNDSGIKVSGYGKDTQYFPIAGTDEGAVLYPGELVVNAQQREKIAADTGVDVADYVPGPKSGKVKKYASGGMIGIAAHHLKQDEALSSLTKGVNDYVKPGGKSIRSGTPWSNITKSTPIHSYIDSVGQATIGWGSTFYDNILNGKKPVRPGDTITKSKADDVLSTNLLNLAKEYSQKIPLWNNMSDKQKAGVLIVGYNAPYGPIGSYPKLTESLKTGNMISAASNVTRGGPSPSRLALEKSLLMSGPSNLSSIKKPQSYTQPKTETKDKGILSKLRSFLPFEGGGFPVKENTGMDIPGATADRQLVSMRLHPGEYAKIFTKDFVDKGGMKIVEYLQALLDSDSNARKDGVLSNSSLNRYIPEPPSKNKSGSNMITLPPQIISGGSGQSYNSKGNNGVPNFSAIPSSALETRQNLADIYGILG